MNKLVHTLLYTDIEDCNNGPQMFQTALPMTELTGSKSGFNENSNLTLIVDDLKPENKLHPAEIINLQVQLNHLNQKSKSYNDSMLLEELNINNNICKIDRIKSRKMAIIQNIKYSEMMLNKLKAMEKNLKTDISETKHRIEMKSKMLQSIAFMKDEIENKIDEVDLNNSTNQMKGDIQATP